MKKAIFMPVVLLTAIFMTTHAVADMYKWTDKNGEVHYTQTPPPPDANGKNIEDDIRLSTGKLGNVIPKENSTSEPKDTLEQARQDGEKSDQKHREFCAQQAEALKKMTANALIKWKDAQGERFLTAEEKTTKMKEIQENIDSMCKPEMFSKSSNKSTSQTEKAVDARLTDDTDKTSELNPNNAMPDAANVAGSSTENQTNQATAAMLPATD
jgi:hypothetical protein